MNSWFKNSITMHIFLDSYVGCREKERTSPEFLGGNLQGIIEKLDYFSWLGVNCLWLSPFYKSVSYHGYDITDFFSVNPRFGTIEDLHFLIDEAHRRGIKLIADFVPNHCSHLHSFFMEAQADKNSPYYNWFYFTKWPDKYLCFLNYPSLPKLNLSNYQARSHIIRAAKYWLSWGFDGLRLDHAVGPDLLFWNEFRQQIKKEYPAACLIGEVALAGVSFNHIRTLGIKHRYLRFIFGAKAETIYRDYYGILDGVLDFRVLELIKNFASSHRTSTDILLLANNIQKHFSLLPKDFLLPVFLDNHDMDRFMFVCNQNKDVFKQCYETLFSLNQPVILYYGTETGMTQNAPISSLSCHGDMLARQPMPWEHLDQDMLEFFRGLIWNKRSQIESC